MEFFCCSCPIKCNVILDGKDLGPNKDKTGKLRTLQCNEGLHTISLQCPDGNKCSPSQVTIEITATDPILPLKVMFQCE